jgi:hypothetical protein
MDVGYERPAIEAEGRLRFPTGGILAALFAAWIGLMTLAIVNVASELNAGFQAWITLHSGIGPYSGKELLMLVAWLVSWPVLHVALRRREMNVRRWFGAFLLLLLVATVLMWPPLFKGIADAWKGG